MTADLTPVARLSRDLRKASEMMSINEARYLVDVYYQMQADRIRDDAQIRSISETQEPTGVVAYLADQHATLETQIAGALDRFSNAQPIGRWMRGNVGIGPIIAAGLIAHIDITRAPTVGHIWRYAGLDPTLKWEKKTKRPWNAQLKVLCWKLGESFVKTSGHEESFYGPIYRQRKEYEIARNERGDNAATAAEILSAKKFGADTEARKHLEAGRLPPAQLHARARRYAVKLFLSHMHETWRKLEGLPVVAPYPIAHLSHAHPIAPPNVGASV